MLNRIKWLTLSSMLLALSACNDEDTAAVLTAVTVIDAGELCQSGGSQIDSGLDDNSNGMLDADEITSTQLLCNDAETSLDMNVADIELLETESAVFNLTLNNARDDDTVIYFEVASNTAQIGVDIPDEFGLVTIPAGETAATISIPVYVDAVCELEETFSLNVTANDVSTTASATITDVCDVDIDNDNLIEVYSLNNLDWMRNDLAGASRTDFLGNSLAVGCASACNGYELMADLDFDTNADGQINVEDDFYNSNQGWTPVGSSSAPFSGNFDGNGFEIRNLQINQPNGSNVGLFGYTESATTTEISNVGLAGDLMSISAEDQVGTLVGYANSNIVVSNSYATGLVESTDHVSAGLVAYVYSGDAQINDSYFSGSISGEFSVGGLLGFVDQEAEINNSYAIVEITTGTANPSNAGGLVAYADSIDIAGSSFTGNITSPDNNLVGGLAGYVYLGGSIVESYATGSITTGGDQVGGLVGGCFGNLTVAASFFSGSVSANDYAGGLVGRCTEALTITSSFATGSVASADESAGGLAGQIESVLTIDSSYAVTTISAAIYEGGLVGNVDDLVVDDSYWASDISAVAASYGQANNSLVETATFAVPLAELQCPTASNDTACSGSGTLYNGWEALLDADTNPYWNFGSINELPGLNLAGSLYVDADGSGMLD